jgi:2-oxoglutarate dehydrogenase E2 component (dihydrolipoamide succinyltransferase)
MDIRIPEVGESVQEALLAKWFKNTGDHVKKDEPLCEIETDKITMDVIADADGVFSRQVEEGVTVKIGTIIGTIVELPGDAQGVPDPAAILNTPVNHDFELNKAVSSPSVRREMREQGVDPYLVTGTGRGGRITLDDLFSRIEEKARRNPPVTAENIAGSPNTAQSTAIKQPATAPVTAEAPGISVRSEEAPSYDVRREERKQISPIRKRIAERLVAARQQTAMLTTFNEVDVTQVTVLREKYRDHFKILHGVSLGLMPFFVKACVQALREFPEVNASIEGDVFVYHNYYDIGIAIGAEKGLVVPILRDADKMRYFEIDKAIAAYKDKIATNKIAISDLTGGTFSISNGGVYGSMLSTPILNPPQSAVLGMHAIQDRPVVRDGQIVIRPMMYLALSYDHRIIDGRQAVGFLKKIKEYIEEPEELLLEG